VAFSDEGGNIGSITGIAARTLNVAIGCVGAPGTGKSTYALARLLEYGRILPAYCIAHDVGWKLPDTLPGGRQTGIIRHDSFSSAQSRLASDPRGVHAITCTDAGPVIEYGMKLAGESLRKNNGVSGFPVMIMIDEIVSMSGATPNRFEQLIKEMLVLRRHKNIGILWTAQSPRLCHNQLLGQATEIIVFRLNHKKDFDTLADVGFSDKELDVIRSLPDFHYIIHECK